MGRRVGRRYPWTSGSLQTSPLATRLTACRATTSPTQACRTCEYCAPCPHGSAHTSRWEPLSSQSRDFGRLVCLSNAPSHLMTIFPPPFCLPGPAYPAPLSLILIYYILSYKSRGVLNPLKLFFSSMISAI